MTGPDPESELPRFETKATPVSFYTNVTIVESVVVVYAGKDWPGEPALALSREAAIILHACLQARLAEITALSSVTPDGEERISIKV